ncbi:MAG: type II secretion system protein [Candidatus Dojkabacteria bacterium]|nr:MAG: type II secretion system protein [Candidatus Dojkabacteria bacterium]
MKDMPPVSGQKKYNVKAFTMIELLIVMLITSMLFLIALVLGANTRNVFISGQILKEVVVTARSARRSSMLITKDVNENWVHAVGIEIAFDNALQQWTYYTVKLQHSTPNLESNTFYIPYPANISNYNFNRSSDVRVIDSNATFAFYRPNGAAICTGTGSRMRVMFKSVNGTPVVYCGTQDITSLGGLDIGTNFSSTKITIRTDGNISAINN